MAPPSPSKPGPLTSHPVTPAFPPTSTANVSPSKQRSRFQEGSMNDRTSAVPPLSFIGPEQEAFERRMELHYPGAEPPLRPSHDRATSSMDAYPAPNSAPAAAASRPISAASSYTGKRGFWGGLREKFSFSKDRADGAKRPVSLDTKVDRTMGMGAGGGRDPKHLPSREEIMANYQDLMRNGFFDSHVIQSTRQPHPGASKPSTPSQPMPPSGTSFASRMSDTQRRQNQNWPLPTISSPGAESNTSRGTKRMHSQDNDSEHTVAEPSSSFKRLRKSASRISADISIPRLRNKRSHLTQEQQHAVDIAAMPPPPAPTGINTRRSFSSSSRRDTNRLAKRNRPITKCAISAPIPLPPPSSDGASNPDAFGMARMSLDSGAPSFTSSIDSRPGSSATAASGQTNWTLVPNAEDAPEPAPPPPALRVRPDANRGIPMVPRIPDQFKTRSGHSGAENLVPPVRQTQRGQWAR